MDWQVLVCGAVLGVGYSLFLIACFAAQWEGELREQRRDEILEQLAEKLRET